jgi:hypothetical protein
VLRATGKVIARFPFVVISAAVGTVASIDAIESSGVSVANILMPAALGLPLMLALRLIRERMANRSAGMALEIVGIVVLIAYSASLPFDYNGAPSIFLIRFSVINIGLHFAVAYAPCITGASEWEYWQYNRKLFQRFALTFLYTTVLYVGLTLALASFYKLLDIKVEPKRFGELWVVMIGMFNTLFFLGGVPEPSGELEGDTSYPKGLRAFAQFALAPLVIVFVAILYLYAIRIAATQTWPHGWVGKPIYFFSVVGILAALLLQPARSIESERWARWYWRFFFPVLGPLAILLLLAVKERLSDFGFTELRYYGLVLGIWLLAVSIFFTVRPGGSTRSIPGTLALICLLTSLGPWSVYSVSSASQEQRLVKFLTPLGAVENGSLVPAKHSLSPKDSEYARSVLGHLISVYGREHFPVLFARYEKDAKPKAAKNSMGFVDVGPVIMFLQGNNPSAPFSSNTGFHSISIKIDGSHGISTEGYRLLYHLKFPMGRGVQHAGDLTVDFPHGSDAVRISLSGRQLDATPVTNLMKSILAAGKGNKRNLPASMMSAKVTADSREWLFVANEVSGYSRDLESPNLNLIEFDVFEK